MWKNFMVQYRHRVQTIVQILLPVVFSVCLIIIRSLVQPMVFPYNTTYKSFNPNTGLSSLIALGNETTKIQELRMVYSPKNDILDEFLTNVSISLGLPEIPEGVETPEEVQKVMTERFLLCGVIFSNYSNVNEVHFL